MTRQGETAEKRDGRPPSHARVELEERHFAPALVVEKLQAANPGIIDVLDELGAPLPHGRRRRRRYRRDGQPRAVETLGAQAQRVQAAEQLAVLGHEMEVVPEAFN